MFIKAKPPALATRAALENRSASRLNYFHNSRTASDLQDVATAIVAERYRLPPYMARLVCHLANIGGLSA